MNYAIAIDGKALDFIVYLLGARPYAEVASVVEEIKRQRAEQDQARQAKAGDE